MEKFNHEVIYKNLSEKVFTKMKKTELARKMKILPQSLNSILNNLKKGNSCRISTLDRISEASGVSVEELTKN